MFLSDLDIFCPTRGVAPIGPNTGQSEKILNQHGHEAKDLRLEPYSGSGVWSAVAGKRD